MTPSPAKYVFQIPKINAVVNVVLTLTRIIKSVVTGQAPVTLSGAEEYPRETSQTNPRWYTHISQLTQFMPPSETDKSETGSQLTMCQVYTGAYVSLLASGKSDYTVCHPRKTTYILHVVPITTHTHDRRKSIGTKETKKRKQDKGKKRKEKTMCTSETPKLWEFQNFSLEPARMPSTPKPASLMLSLC